MHNYIHNISEKLKELNPAFTFVGSESPKVPKVGDLYYKDGNINVVLDNNNDTELISISTDGSVNG